jgi:hypothetical protein
MNPRELGHQRRAFGRAAVPADLDRVIVDGPQVGAVGQQHSRGAALEELGSTKVG